MKIDPANTLVIGISSRSLFDLEEENRIFLEEGLEAYRAYPCRACLARAIDVFMDEPFRSR